MADHHRDPRAEPKTIDIPKTEIIEGLLRALQGTVTDGFRAVNHDIQVLVEDGRATRDRLSAVEARQATASINVRSSVTADAEHAKALAVETTRRKSLESELLRTREQLETLSEEVKATTEETAETKALVVSHTTVLDEQTKELAKQTAILTRLAKVASSPMAKEVLRTIAQALLTWAAIKGLR